MTVKLETKPLDTKAGAAISPPQNGIQTATQIITPIDTAAERVESEATIHAIDNLWKVYGTLNDWIKFSDTKAGYILGANTVLTGAAITAFNGNSAFMVAHPLVPSVMALALLTALVSTIYCLRCIQPNLGSGVGDSLIFFHHVQQNHKDGHKTYMEAVQKAHQEENGFLEQLSQQIHANSGVATRKSRSIIAAVRSLAAMLALLLASALIATGYIARQQWQTVHSAPPPAASVPKPVSHAGKPGKH